MNPGIELKNIVSHIGCNYCNYAIRSYYVLNFLDGSFIIPSFRAMLVLETAYGFGFIISGNIPHMKVGRRIEFQPDPLTPDGATGLNVFRMASRFVIETRPTPRNDTDRKSVV